MARRDPVIRKVINEVQELLDLDILPHPTGCNSEPTMSVQQNGMRVSFLGNKEAAQNLITKLEKGYRKPKPEKENRVKMRCFGGPFDGQFLLFRKGMFSVQTLRFKTDEHDFGCYRRVNNELHWGLKPC